MIKYQAFIKVAELGSITKAAKALGYSQPGISHIIDAFEAEIGFPLLMRTRDSLQPTDDGKKILNYCYQLVKTENDMKNTVQAVKGLSSGTIHIGSQNSMMVNFVPKIVANFSKAYSNIELWVHEFPFAHFAPNLQNGIIDIAFMSSFSMKGYDFIPLFKDPVCIAMHEDHPFTKYDKVPISALNGCDFIMPLNGWDDIVNIIIEKQTFTPNIKHYVASDTAGIAMASENLGVYILSGLQTGLLPQNIVYREVDGDFYRTMGICVKSLKYISPALKEFINTAQQIVSRELSNHNLLKPVK